MIPMSTTSLRSTRPLAVVVACLGLALAVGCGKKADTDPPVATPGVSFNKARAALGSPVVATYRFQVAPDAPPFGADYRVMVHVLDNEDVLMWTDDHAPAVPTSQWKPGQTVEYTREIFVPIYPYTGTASVRMGLYAEDGRRLPLAGENDGQRGYTVGTIDLLPQSENVFLVYKDGWNPEEVAQNNPAVTWQWTKRAATIAFKHPRRDATFYLHADARPDLVGRPVQVTVGIGGTVIETLTFDSTAEVLKKAVDFEGAVRRGRQRGSLDHGGSGVHPGADARRQQQGSPRTRAARVPCVHRAEVGPDASPAARRPGIGRGTAGSALC